jgi:predicted TIM-barrel fold metal-dependent hydrolase
MSGIIDIVVNMFTPQEVELGQTGLDEDFKEQVRMPKEMRGGVTIPDYINKMDQAGVERSLLIAVRAGDIRVPESFEVPYERVHKVCQKHPERFSGLAGVDPFRGMEGLNDLEVAVKEYGFVGAHLYPHWCELPPNHRKYYPYYAKCCELEIPIMMQVGHNLIYSKNRRLPSVGKPIYLDQVAIDFPELKLIGIHIGIPWTEEMISMCWKHENIYTAGDAYAPKYWPEAFIHYANSYGKHKVMFGTDWPVIDPIRAVDEFNNLNFKDSSKELVLRENAVRVFNLGK